MIICDVFKKNDIKMDVNTHGTKVPTLLQDFCDVYDEMKRRKLNYIKGITYDRDGYPLEDKFVSKEDLWKVIEVLSMFELMSIEMVENKE